jgi:hypothetical protein
MLGKNRSHRKLTRKLSHQRASFNDRLELSDWPEKDGAALTLGYMWLL